MNNMKHILITIIAALLFFDVQAQGYGTGSVDWTTSGNRVLERNFLGTINYSPLNFKTSGQSAGKFSESGNFYLYKVAQKSTDTILGIMPDGEVIKKIIATSGDCNEQCLSCDTSVSSYSVSLGDSSVYLSLSPICQYEELHIQWGDSYFTGPDLNLLIGVYEHSAFTYTVQAGFTFHRNDSIVWSDVLTAINHYNDMRGENVIQDSILTSMIYHEGLNIYADTATRTIIIQKDSSLCGGLVALVEGEAMNQHHTLDSISTSSPHAEVHYFDNGIFSTYYINGHYSLWVSQDSSLYIDKTSEVVDNQWYSSDTSYKYYLITTYDSIYNKIDTVKAGTIPTIHRSSSINNLPSTTTINLGLSDLVARDSVGSVTYEAITFDIKIWNKTFRYPVMSRRRSPDGHYTYLNYTEIKQSIVSELGGGDTYYGIRFTFDDSLGLINMTRVTDCNLYQYELEIKFSISSDSIENLYQNRPITCSNNRDNNISRDTMNISSYSKNNFNEYGVCPLQTILKVRRNNTWIDVTDSIIDGQYISSIPFDTWAIYQEVLDSNSNVINELLLSGVPSVDESSQSVSICSLIQQLSNRLDTLENTDTPYPAIANPTNDSEDRQAIISILGVLRNLNLIEP